jgi:putative transposase
MPRGARVDDPNNYYHVINRSNFKNEFNSTDSDYIEFFRIIREALEIAPVKIYAYCIMPNHWHFIMSPYEVGGIGKFIHALANKHTRRVHSRTNTTGFGPLYQSRYKSMIIDSGISFLKVLRYVERNAVRAGLVKKPNEWRWGSAWLRIFGNEKQKLILEKLPDGLYEDFGDVYKYVDLPDEQDDLKLIRNSIKKGTPFGKEKWVDKMIKSYGLESTVRNAGRQRNC